MAEIEPSGLKANPNEYYDRQIVESMISGDLPPVSTSHVINYAIEIDISDNTDIPDEPVIGLFNDALLNGGAGGSAFRIITGRPNYDGSTVVPTGELSTANAIKWGEGVISSRGSLGSPVRIINVLTSGDYGSLSGVNFSLDNIKIESGTFEGQPLFDIIDDEKFFMLNRTIRYYVVIDNVFYNVWTGIVQKYSYNETKIDLICQDNFQNAHKVLPPQTANETSFSGILKKTIGKPIPVTFGYQNNAKLLNIQVTSEPLVIARTNGQDRMIAQVSAYDTTEDGSGNITEVLVQINVGKLKNEESIFLGKFLKFVLAGASEEAFKITRIQGVTTFPSGERHVTLEIDAKTDESTITPVPPNAAGAELGTWVEVFDFENSYIVSNEKITDFPNDNFGDTKQLSYFDKDQFDYVDVSEIIGKSSEDDINSYGFPGITAFTDVTGNDGSFVKLFPFTPKRAYRIRALDFTKPGSLVSDDFPPINEDVPNVIDKDPLTGNSAVFQQIAPGQNSRFSCNILFDLPDEMLNANYDKFYVLGNWTVQSESASVEEVDQEIGIAFYDLNGRLLIRYKDEIISRNIAMSTGNFTASEIKSFDLIPPIYYGDSENNPLLFGIKKEQLNISDVYDSKVAFRAVPTLEVTFGSGHELTGPGNNITITVNEVCFAGEKEINIINDDIFIKTIGERTDISDEPTTNLYNIFLKILESYDGLTDGDDFDLTGIDSRKNWGAGRQITERAKSFNYLKEMAQQSFVGIFPGRSGKRKLKAFRDFTDPVAEFSDTSGNIVQGTISPIILSDINQVYNEFEINYEWNEPAKRFEKSVFIKKVDEDSFPERHLSTDGANDFEDSAAIKAVFSIDTNGSSEVLVQWAALPSEFAIVGLIVSYEAENGIIDYGEIVSVQAAEIQVSFENLSGFMDGDEETGPITMRIHSTRVKLWTTFAGGMTDYNRSSEMWNACHQAYLKTLVVNPLPKRLGDCRWFVDESNFKADPGMYSSPVMLLEHIVEWSTRQKEIANFHIPITPEHAELELLDFTTFRDKKHTAGEQKEGYISKIKINPPTDTIILELTLIPSDIEDIRGCLIIETGTSPDTITELGTNPDTITEPSDC
jgi:hypothetical protein